MAKLAIAALAAADAPPSGLSAEKKSLMGRAVGLDEIAAAIPVGGEQVVAPGSSGGDNGAAGGADGAGRAPGNSEEREGNDGGSQSSSAGGLEDGSVDRSITSNTSSRASAASLAMLSRRASEAGVTVSERGQCWLEATDTEHETIAACLCVCARARLCFPP